MVENWVRMRLNSERILKSLEYRKICNIISPVCRRPTYDMIFIVRSN